MLKYLYNQVPTPYNRFIHTELFIAHTKASLLINMESDTWVLYNIL